jgi:hypothetical protein
MGPKNKTKTKAIVKQNASPYNAGLAQYTDLALTASTLSENFRSVRYECILWIFKVFFYFTRLTEFHHLQLANICPSIFCWLSSHFLQDIWISWTACGALWDQNGCLPLLEGPQLGWRIWRVENLLHALPTQTWLYQPWCKSIRYTGLLHNWPFFVWLWVCISHWGSKCD